MKWTVGARLITLSGTGLLFVIAIGLAGYIGSRNIGKGMTAVTTTADALQHHMEADMMHDALRGDVIAALLAKDQAAKDAVAADLKEHADVFLGNIAANDKLDLAPEVKMDLEEVKPSLDRYIDMAGKHVELAFSDAAAAEGALPEFMAAFGELEEKMGAMSDHISEGMNAAREEQQAAVQSFRRNLLILLVCAAVVLTALSLGIARGITRPINIVVSSLRDIAEGEGDLTRRIEFTRRDEIGELARWFNTFLDKLQPVIQRVTERTGNLTASSENLSGVSRQLVDGSREMAVQTSTVASTTEEMSANVSAMAAAAEEMSVNVQTISSTSVQMSENMNSVASAIEEISVTIRDMSENVNSTSAVAQEAACTALNANKTMQALGNAANEIGKVTGVIKRIAQQTNLLALNATIEAASAGSAGSGFAVVANEIKQLANQSGQAAEEIASLIGGIQKDTGMAVGEIETVSKVIEGISKSIAAIATAVGQQSGAVDEIAANVGESNKGAGEIASSIAQAARASVEISTNAGELASGVNELSRSIQRVNQESERSNTGALNVSGAATALADVAFELGGLVGVFKVDSAPGRAPAPQPGAHQSTPRRAARQHAA